MLMRNKNVLFQTFGALFVIAKSPNKIKAIGTRRDAIPAVWIKRSEIYDPGRLIKFVETSSDEVLMLWSN